MASPDTSKEFAIYPQLAGKVAIVTGASRGLGRVLTEGLLANDVRVVINSTNQANLDVVANEIDPSGEKVLAVAGDIGRPSRAAWIEQEDGSFSEEVVPSTAELLFKKGQERWSAKASSEGEKEGIVIPEMAFHLAGVNRDNLYARPRQTREDFQAVNNAKINGTWEMVNAVFDGWSRLRTGTFVDFSSVSRKFKPVGQSLYSAANAWIENYLSAIDKEVTGDGKRDAIRYIAVQLGPADEGMMWDLKEKNLKMFDFFLASMPDDKLISPYSIVNRVLDLVTRTASPRLESIDIFDGGFDPELGLAKLAAVAKPQE